MEEGNGSLFRQDDEGRWVDHAPKKGCPPVPAITPPPYEELDRLFLSHISVSW